METKTFIICRTRRKLKSLYATRARTSLKRGFADRLLNDPGRNKFHGDKFMNSGKEQDRLMTDHYEPVNIDAPTLEVDTTENYNPDLGEIISFIKKNNGC